MLSTRRSIVRLAGSTRNAIAIRPVNNRYASNLSDAVRDKAKKALKRGSNIVSDVYEKRKSDTLNAVSSVSHSVKGKIEEKSARLSRTASDAVRKTSSNLSQQVQAAGQTASTIVKEKSGQAISTATEKIQTGTKSVAQGAAQSVRKAKTGIFGNAQDFARKATRFLWWWSLAAIGVYGIATTVPREFIRYALEGKKSNDNVQSSGNSSNRDEVANNAENQNWGKSLLGVFGATEAESGTNEQIKNKEENDRTLKQRWWG